MKYIFIVLFAFCLLTVQAQDINPNCDGSRFLTEIFPEEPDMTTVKFGENTTINGVEQELFMDVFQPSGDVADDRPVILFAYGGYFLYGNRTDMHEISKFYAKKGYVTAAIDYRLYDKELPPTGPFPDSIAMMTVVLQAVSDYKAAIRYFRKDADGPNLFRIDPNFIFVGGSSAGAIAALHTACMDPGESTSYLDPILLANGGLEGNTDDPDNPNAGYSSEVKGVINYFGALHKKEWLDANDPPFISIHGDMDAIVPYGHGFAVVVIIPIITVDGSGELHPVAESLGIKNELITVPGGGHGNFSEAFYNQMDERSSLFLTDILCGETSDTKQVPSPVNYTSYPNPVTQYIKLQFTTDPGTYQLSLIDQVGRKVYTQTGLMGKEQVINRNTVPSGLYIMSIEFSDKHIQPVRQKILFQ